MNFNELINQLDEQSKDIKINLERVLLTPTDELLTENELQAISLAVSYSLQDPTIIEASRQFAEGLDETHIKATTLCANLMAMNNTYYRSIHLLEQPQLVQLPAGLRMQGIRQHAIDNNLFELMSFAVSAVNGCGMCLQAHYQQLKTHYADQQITYALRISAVLTALKQCIAER